MASDVQGCLWRRCTPWAGSLDATGASGCGSARPECVGERVAAIRGLYFDRGEGTRYRSLGCYPCTSPVESTATNVDEIVEDLRGGKFANIAERSGRAQDKDDGGGLETLRRDGYM